MFSLSLSAPSISFLPCGKSRGMTGAHRMQELKHFRGGATLRISMDGLNWLSRRRCSDGGIKKRDEELHLWISSGQMRQADEERQPVTCFCILDHRGSAALKSRRNTHYTSSLLTRSSSFSVSPRHCCLPREPIQQSLLTSLDLFATDFPEKTAWTGLILNVRDILGLITKNLNESTQQDSIAMDPHNEFIIFCDDCTPAQHFSDMYPTQDCRTVMGHTGCHLSDDNSMSVDLKNSNASSEDGQRETSRGNLNTHNMRSLLKSCRNYNQPGASSGSDRNVKMRKSVSFDDDVMVYLFDQESPTLELHSEPCTSLPSSYSCNLPGVTSEDSGLEWEDDFSALEKNCSLQCVRHSQHSTLSLPTRSWTAPSGPGRCCVSQTCLFLTYVTESDLEL